MFDANKDGLTIGVVGAGAMGQGIVQVGLQGGMTVVLHDAVEGGAKAGADKIFARLDRLAEKGKYESNDVDNMKQNLKIASQLSDLKECSVVIEAIFEDIDVKRELFKSVEEHVSDTCIIASNTSSLPIGSIARACAHPGRVAGLHFFNPVPLMRLVEVIQGPATEDWVISGLEDLGKRMGRTPVAVKDSPGFLVNMGGRAYTTESLHILQEGVASPAEVDAVMRDCGHFRMGPFELMDLTGIDVNYPVSMIVFEQYLNDPRLRTTPHHKGLYDAGRFGRKTGQGHFKYDEKFNQVDTPSADYETEAMAATRVFVAEPNAVLSDLIIDCGISVAAADDRQNPIVAALFGEDCASFCARTGTDPKRLVAIDVTADISKRITIMTAVGADPAILDAVAAALIKGGKKVTAIKDSAGFISQRMRAMVANLGCEMAQIGLASPADIDTAMQLGLNYPQGPLEIADDFGCETLYAIMCQMHEISGDPRYRPSVWLRRRAQLGLSASTPD